VHDKWVIDKIEQYPNNVIQIFNRYGAKIFERRGYSSVTAWDGTNNGQPVPVGAYYYVLNYGDGRKPVGGVISIVR
jgi:gliding motility-associated-like protein